MINKQVGLNLDFNNLVDKDEQSIQASTTTETIEESKTSDDKSASGNAVNL